MISEKTSLAEVFFCLRVVFLKLVFVVEALVWGVVRCVHLNGALSLSGDWLYARVWAYKPLFWGARAGFNFGALFAKRFNQLVERIYCA